MTDYEEAREAIREILCRNCEGDCDMQEEEYCSEVMGNTAKILALPQIGVIASDQDPTKSMRYNIIAELHGRTDLKDQGWRKLVEKEG